MAVAVAAAVGGSIGIGLGYGGDALWPDLLTSFGASLAAFVVALSWEASRERQRAIAEANAAVAKARMESEELTNRRATEVRRRLESVKHELSRNEKSLKDLDALLNPDALQILHPQLLDGAWTANAPRLAELVADYRLISDLTEAYGRIEELRWRLRQRTATLSVAAGSRIAQRLATSPGKMGDASLPVV